MWLLPQKWLKSLTQAGGWKKKTRRNKPPCRSSSRRALRNEGTKGGGSPRSYTRRPVCTRKNTLRNVESAVGTEATTASERRARCEETDSSAVFSSPLSISILSAPQFPAVAAEMSGVLSEALRASTFAPCEIKLCRPPPPPSTHPIPPPSDPTRVVEKQADQTWTSAARSRGEGQKKGRRRRQRQKKKSESESEPEPYLLTLCCHGARSSTHVCCAQITAVSSSSTPKHHETGKGIYLCIYTLHMYVGCVFVCGEGSLKKKQGYQRENPNMVPLLSVLNC